VCRTVCGENCGTRPNLPQSSSYIAAPDGSALRRRGVRGEMTMAKPTVIVVGADKGGVGKTTVCPHMLDYFTAHHVPTRAFDTEALRAP